MNKCKATLTTATVDPHSGVATLHTIECDLPWPHDVQKHCNSWRGPMLLHWNDKAPGSTPHEPPLVTDAEVEAAMAAYRDVNRVANSTAVRAALEAAAKARAAASKDGDGVT